MATLTPEEEGTLNPGQNDWDRKVKHQNSTGGALSEAEKDASSDVAGNFNPTAANSSRENANITSLRNSEESGKKKESDKYEKLKLARSQKLGINLLKKKGPLSFVGALALGGGGVFTALMSPGIALVQVKQALMDDLNDAVAAMDYRSQHIIRAKLKKQTSGFCTRSVSIRCNYRGMSQKQIDKMRKAGMHVKTSGKTLTGKYKIEAIGMSRPDGSSPFDGQDRPGDNKLRIDARNFNRAYNKNPGFRTAMHASWAPRWMSVNDSTGKNVAEKHGFKRHRLINASSEDEVKRQWNQGVKDGFAESEGREGLRKVTNEDGSTRYIDQNGDTIKNPDGVEIDANKIDSDVADLKKSVRGGGLGKGIGKLTRSANAVTGIQAEICGWYKKLKIAGVLSRTLKYAQAARLFYMIANTADAVVDGTGTFEAVSTVSSKITSGDGRTKIPNSDAAANQDAGILTGIVDATENNRVDPNDLVKNPDYQKTAFDSVGLRASIDGETPGTISSRESSASLTGGLGTKLSGVANTLANFALFDSSRCHIYENPIVQGASLLLSFAVYLTPGANVAAAGWQGAKAAAMLGVGLAIDAYTSKLITNLSEGNTFDYDNADNLDLGNALFTGAAATTSASSSARGMTPVSTHEEIESYQKVAANIKNQNIELDRIATQDTPLDMYNQYSFLGSIVWSLNPSFVRSQSTIASVATSSLTTLSTALKWLSPRAFAATPSNIARFQKNDDDPTYQNINLKGSDLMGNIRFGMTDDQLNADPDKVTSWMIDARQVDPKSGEVLKSCEALQTAIDQPASNPDELLGMRMDDEPYSDIAENTASEQAELTDLNQPLPNPDQNNVERDISEYARPHGTSCDETAVERDVRTYAHFLRYCRFGPKEGRKVNFGDGDAGDKKGNALTGLASGEWQSDGRECLRANACEPNQDPNGNSSAGDSRQYESFCRPSYYDIYAVYTMDKQVDESFDEDDEDNIKSVNQETSSDDWVYPTTGDAQTTSGYKTPDRPGHRGIDIAHPGGSEGKPIYATRDGEVVHAACDDPGGFGCWIVIKHEVDGEQMDSVYGHMWPQDLDVKKGDKVKAGDEISKIGNNGGSSGAHLHFELWKGGRFDGGEEIDPEPILKDAERKGGSSNSGGSVNT